MENDKPNFPVMESEYDKFPTTELQIQENIRRGYLHQDGRMTVLGLVFMEYMQNKPTVH